MLRTRALALALVVMSCSAERRTVGHGAREADRSSEGEGEPSGPDGGGDDGTSAGVARQRRGEKSTG